jgi:hypothetical protein
LSIGVGGFFRVVLVANKVDLQDFQELLGHTIIRLTKDT